MTDSIVIVTTVNDMFYTNMVRACFGSLNVK